MVATALAASGAVAFVVARPGDDTGGSLTGVYDLPSLDGTAAAGTTTNSPVVRLILSGTVPRVKTLIRLQDEGVRSYRELALRGLRHQAGAMTGPRDGERAVLMQSDMHCNTTMVTLQHEVVTMLHRRYGTRSPALLAITGDLTTNGTAAEGRCIEDEAAIAGRRRSSRSPATTSRR